MADVQENPPTPAEIALSVLAEAQEMQVLICISKDAEGEVHYRYSMDRVLEMIGMLEVVKAELVERGRERVDEDEEEEE